MNASLWILSRKCIRHHGNPPTSAWPEVSGIWYKISPWDAVWELVVLSWLPWKKVEEG